VNFAETPTGTSSAISVDADGYFNVPSDGYLIVTGADDTTYVYATWADWTEGYEGEFEPYTDYAVDFSSVMVFFNAGLLAIGDVRDEINFNTQKAISRIERLAYTPENLEDVIASGRPYETDTNYIYCVRASYVETDIAIDGTYTVSDHGIEFYTATTTTPPVTECIYGNNLKDKLRMDVLTISAQNLSAAQQAQVQTNIDVPSTANMVARDTALQNQITTLNSNITSLDAFNEVALTPAGSDFTADVYCRAYANKNMIFIDISATISATIAGWNKIASIPGAYAPRMDTHFLVMHIQQDAPHYMYVGSSGEIFVYGTVSGKIRGSIMYPIGK
jgi:hypothetical protein